MLFESRISVSESPCDAEAGMIFFRLVGDAGDAQLNYLSTVVLIAANLPKPSL